MATHKHVGCAEKKLHKEKKKKKKRKGSRKQSKLQRVIANAHRHTFMECLSWKDNPERITYTTFN